MKTPLTLACAAFLAWAAQAASAPTGAPVAAPPNFLLILADDLGFSDLGCYGSEIATPHLDRLARDGVRFTQFYNTARCWPTRGALVTGYQSLRKFMHLVEPSTCCTTNNRRIKGRKIFGVRRFSKPRGKIPISPMVSRSFCPGALRPG